MKDKIPCFGGSAPLTRSRTACYFGLRNGVILLVAAALTYACLPGSGQALGLTFSPRLAWNPEQGLLFSSEIGITLAHDSISAISKFKVHDTGLESLALELRWQALPLRNTAKVIFLSSGFREGLLEFGYWARPWSGKLTGRVASDTPFQLEFEGAYEENLTARAYGSVGGALSFQTLELGLTVPLDVLGKVSGLVKLKREEAPSFTALWKIPTSLGELQLEFINLRFSSLEFYREWSEEGAEHELDFTLDLEAAWKWELYQKSTFYFTEKTGYSVSWKLRQLETLELRSLSLTAFAPGFKVVLKPLSEELQVEWRRTLEKQTEVGASLYLGPADWEGNFWFWWAPTSVLELVLGIDIKKAGLDSVYCELYAAF